MIHLVLLHLACLATETLAIATCYRGDTHNPTETIYTPCNALQPFSMCYRSQVDTHGSPPDYACLPQGLTLSNNTQWGVGYWRQGCTDSSWKSPYCQTAFDGCAADENGNVPVTPCSGVNSTDWCCGIGNMACCGTSQAIVIAAVIGPKSSTSSSSISSQTSTSTSQSQSTTAPAFSSSSSTPTSNPKPQQPGLSGAAKAGISIGAALLVLSALGLGALLVLRKRKDSEKVPLWMGASVAKGVELDDGSYPFEANRGGYRVNELEGRHGRSELSGYS